VVQAKEGSAKGAIAYQPSPSGWDIEGKGSQAFSPKLLLPYIYIPDTQSIG